MNRIIVLALALFMFVAAPAAGFAAEHMVQSKCPVMGGAPNEEVYADYEGKRVYFCCPACIDVFKKDPEKYMKMLKDAGMELEDAPKS